MKYPFQSPHWWLTVIFAAICALASEHEMARAVLAANIVISFIILEGRNHD